jgi:hypothetical protein
MISTPATPGLYFTRGERPVEPSPLRSDVAGFAGRTRRGAPGRALRVEGWRAFTREFGGLEKDSLMPYSLRGYFENGGEVAYVMRLCGETARSADATAKTAFAVWKVAELDKGKPTPDSPTAFPWTEYRIEATSPGKWARDTRVVFNYRLQGVSGKPEVDVSVKAPQEPVEYFIGVSPDTLEEEVNARSRLIRLTASGQPITRDPADPVGPRHKSWEMTLSFGMPPKETSEADKLEQPTRVDYLDAIRKLGDEREVALVALPDLYTDIADKADREEIISTAIQQAEQLRDRLVLIDLPAGTEPRADASEDVKATLKWVNDLRTLNNNDRLLRAAVVYHPRLWIPDPLGGIGSPLRSLPPSGHVAGVISRLDRERGSHHTPANAPLYEAVDITLTYEDDEQGLLNTGGVNLLRCTPGRGLQVWGGRTLYREGEGTAGIAFVAHRRLIHRLVRAIRRVAEPLVFYTNGPELWLAFVRAITTVLLESFRAGALKGTRPEEAFRVRCDEKTNPPEERDLGRVLCEVEVAPAVPMEFITLRIALSGDATLEVFES